MIVTELYNGQGLGNQLWSYVVTRCLAIDLGYEFGIMGKEKFKGKDFMDLDFGRRVIGGKGPEGGPPQYLPFGIRHYYSEKGKWYSKYACDIRDFDPDLLKIHDKTKIEGYFQSEHFINHHKKEISNWLRVKPKFEVTDCTAEDLCVLNVRGGEYKYVPELALQKKYWEDAMDNMRKIRADMRFVIVSDDPQYAQELLPGIEVKHESIGIDYARVKNAHYLILSNSSFAFFPAWTSQTVRKVIAPKYWARHNVSDGYWACAFNLHSAWDWQDRTGKLFDFNECQTELQEYSKIHRLSEITEQPPKILSSPRIGLFSRAKRKFKRVFLHKDHQ